MYKVWYKEPIIAHSPSGKVSEKVQKAQEAEMKKALAKEKLKIETARKEEQLKNSQWTNYDLFKLVTQQEKILDDNFWDPQAFSDDVTLIESQIAKEKWQIKLEGIEKDKINTHGMDFLYGLLLQSHIMNCGFYIEIDENYQPILHDNQTPERTAQLQWLQAQLDKLEFGVDRGHVLRKNDNTSKIATYLGALAYHSGKSGGNLMKYRESLEKEIQEDPNTPLTKEEIQKSNLLPGQKSFLLAWRDRKNDRNLIDIEKNQETFVKNARESVKKKTREQHIQELKDRPFGKSVELFGAGVIGIGLLAFGLKQLFGEKSGVMGKIFGTIMALFGGMIVLPMADKTWQALGGPEMINETNQPINKDRANDNPPARITAKMKKIWWESKEWIRNLQTRIAGPDEWSLLLMREDVGPNISGYPAGALLYALNSERPTEQWEFSSYEKNPKMEEIRATLKKLNNTEKAQLLSLMTESWERQKELDPTKVADDSTKDNSDAEKLTLARIIKDIDDHDKWWNTLPDWVGFKDGLFDQRTQKTEMLKVIADKPASWGNLTLEQLENHFLHDPQIPDAQVGAYLQAFTDAHPDYNTPAFAVVQEYLASLTIPATVDKKTTKLRDFLKNT